MPHRVLHLLSQRPGWTGSGVALDAMVRAAEVRRWDQCAVVGVPADDPPPAVGDLEAARIRPLAFGTDDLPFRLPGMSDVMPYPSTRFSTMTRKQLTTYRQAWLQHLGEVIDDFEPDVIHSHHVWLMSSLIKEINDRIPVVTHCHGTGLRQMELCPDLAKDVQAGCARHEAFIALHGGHAETLQKRLDVAANQISVVGSGFRNDIFHDEGRLPVGPVVTYAGKLSRAKGLPWLIDAVEKVAQRIPDVLLNVAGSGSGPEAEAIRRQMTSSGHVVYHGQVDHNRLADLLRRSAVFALPSFFEGLPLVLVEAAASGCRLVATELPGVVNELQPRLGDCLETVPLPRLESIDQPVAADLPAFVNRLAEALEASLGQPPSRGASRFVEALSWNAVFDRIQAVWRRFV